MSKLDQADTTRLLRDWAEGDRAALDVLAPRVYKELRRVAGNLMQAEQGGRTLTATALVHEAYLRLVDQTQVHSSNPKSPRLLIHLVSATSLSKIA